MYSGLVIRCSNKVQRVHVLWMLLAGIHTLPDSAQGGPVRILAFGDSLTEGWTNEGSLMHPYANRLQLLLRQVNPTVEVIESGVSGERVLVSMESRLASELADAQSRGSKYDWVLLLAGVNDIGYGRPAEAVFSGLRRMYQEVGRHGARLVAMTCMENAGTPLSPRDPQRVHLNIHIREYCARHNGPHGALLLDLEKLIPYASASPEERSAMFDDGLHLTPKGYDRMSDLLHELLKDKVA